MAHKNGTLPHILSLTPPDCPHWFQQVVTHLSQTYHVTSATLQPDTEPVLLQEGIPDIIIVALDKPDSTVSISAELLRQAQPTPLLIGLTNAPAQDLNAVGVDMILPIQSYQLLEMQLQAILNLHTRNRTLSQRNSQLETQNAQLNETLSRSQRVASEINLLKDAIVSTVSHELKTPLLQVKSSVALLGENAGNTDLLLQYAQVAVTRLEAVINNIVRLAESLNMDSQHLGPVLIRESIDYAIRNLRRSWEHKDDTERIRIDLPKSLPPVQAYKQGLAIALQMLLDNALKFSDGPVIISAHKVGHQIHFSVTDNGIGIPKNKIGQIFDSFYQVDATSTRQRGGIGVGLAIVRYIMERHNSRIEVDSQEGKGSTFSFTLPIAEIRQK
ncbi:MAG: HAMP domain-containing histidine kinase [Anaerolineaceae bacterium]|nr:HAMP domain-containing histidine kinase [Anaerolineaceae bacterium]